MELAGLPVSPSSTAYGQVSRGRRHGDTPEMGDKEEHVELAGLPVNPSCTACGRSVGEKAWRHTGSGKEKEHVKLARLPVSPSCTVYGQVSRGEGMVTLRKWEREGTLGASRTSGQPILHNIRSGQ
jgi:hypothetical protein